MSSSVVVIDVGGDDAPVPARQDNDNDDFGSMPYHQLRQECRKAHLVSTGNAETLRKRLRDNWKKEEQKASAAKRQKKSIADELICPITLQLPWEPVMAEDGRVYERSAIETHIQNNVTSNNNDGKVKSPMKNEEMGTKLIPAIQHRNTVAHLVESGVIEGELADKWNEKVAEKIAMEDLVKRAEEGDGAAMHDVGVYSTNGLCGFKKQDKSVAFSWYKKSHEAGSVYGTAALGQSYLYGLGVAQNDKLGMYYSTLAAAQGSNLAAYNLGCAFADGKHGMNVNKTEAIGWLEKAVGGDCTYRHLNVTTKNEAQRKLNELQTSSS